MLSTSIALLGWVVIYSWHLGDLCSNYELWVHVIDGFWAMTLPSVLYNGKRYNVMSVAHDALQELPPARGSLRPPNIELVIT